MAKKFGGNEKAANRMHRAATGGQNAPYAVDGMSGKHSFSKHASLTHEKNMPPRLPMRGGIRL